MAIGWGGSSNGGYCDGAVEFAALFDRALEPHEVQALSNDPYGLILPSWLVGLDFYRRAAGGTGPVMTLGSFAA